MRPSISAAALIALPLSTIASTLNDWAPRLANLNAQCKAVYTEDISGCSEADFHPKSAVCSAACVKGLQDMTGKIQAACGDEDFGNSTEAENILVCFLAGNGPQRVCSNNAVSQTSHTSSKSTVAVQTTTTSSKSSRTEISTTSSSQSETSTTSPGEETMTSTASASPNTTLLLDSTSGISFATPAPSNSQDIQNQGSGGGSPFDDVSSSAGVSSFPTAKTLLVAIWLIARMR